MSAANSPTTESWWQRPAGGREVFIVAVPLVLSTMSWTVLTFIDRMFLNWQSGVAMSASFSGGMVWFVVFCFPMGICTYVSTFVSQYHGDDQPEQIGPSMWQGVWIALLTAPLAAACVPLAPYLFSFAQHSPEITAAETQYFQILCAGGSAMLAVQAFGSFYSGRGQTWVVMLVDGVAALVNVVLDYWWIFGGLGMPEMGIAGAAWATVCALWIKVAIYMLLVLQHCHRQKFHTWTGMRVNRDLFRRLLVYGGPSGAQMLLEVAGFTLFVVLVGRIGALETEATTMAFSISSFAFMPIWGFGLAAGVLVGQHLGENRDDLAERATWTTLTIALAYMSVIAGLFVLAPNLFIGAFFAKSTAAAFDQQTVREMAVVLLRFVALYSMFDACNLVFVSAVKGAGDTRFVLKVSAMMAALLSLISWLAVDVWKLGIYACWTIVTVWICALGVIYFGRFLQGDWRTMRVIEPQHHPIGRQLEVSPRDAEPARPVITPRHNIETCSSE